MKKTTPLNGFGFLVSLQWYFSIDDEVHPIATHPMAVRWQKRGPGARGRSWPSGWRCSSRWPPPPSTNGCPPFWGVSRRLSTGDPTDRIKRSMRVPS